MSSNVRNSWAQFTSLELDIYFAVHKVWYLCNKKQIQGWRVWPIQEIMAIYLQSSLPHKVCCNPWIWNWLEILFSQYSCILNCLFLLLPRWPSVFSWLSQSCSSIYLYRGVLCRPTCKANWILFASVYIHHSCLNWSLNLFLWKWQNESLIYIFESKLLNHLYISHSKDCGWHYLGKISKDLYSVLFVPIRWDPPVPTTVDPRSYNCAK